MDLKTLRDTPPWDWPNGTGSRLIEILRDDDAGESDRVLAAELAGDFTVLDDELALALLLILRSGASDPLRCQAAASLGPALDYASVHGFEDADRVPITERTFRNIQEALQATYRDAGAPVEVRRRALEASVRAPEDWHAGAIRAANGSGDPLWKLTAVFSMRFVRGFDEEILAALNSEDPDVLHEAVLAAGNWEVKEAWPRVAPLVTSTKTEKRLLLAAIEAVASIRPDEAATILGHLLDSRDEDIVEAAYEALAMAEGLGSEDEDEDDEDDEDDKEDKDDKDDELLN